MDGCKSDPWIVGDNRFRSVAMVRVEVPDRDAFDAAIERGQRRDCNVAEITKTHRAIARGMMSRRSHQTECAFSDKCSVRGVDTCAGRFKRIVVNF